MGLTGAALLSSVPAEEQAEFQQLSDEIQELQQLLNQDFRQKTVCSWQALTLRASLQGGAGVHVRTLHRSTGAFAAGPRLPGQFGDGSIGLVSPKNAAPERADPCGTTAVSLSLGCRGSVMLSSYGVELLSTRAVGASGGGWGGVG